MRMTAILLWALLAAGCAASESRRVEDLELQLLAFENALRWGRFSTAEAARRPAPAGVAFDADRYADIRVTALTRLSRQADAAGSRVSVRTRIGYYRTGVFAERQLDYVHAWDYDADAKRWFLVSELPDFR
jgi:hypothetical protein